MYTYVYIYIHTHTCQHLQHKNAIIVHYDIYSLIHIQPWYYWVASISRLLEITGLFCKRALEKRLCSAKETYNFKESTNRSHLVSEYGHAPSRVCGKSDCLPKTKGKKKKDSRTPKGFQWWNQHVGIFSPLCSPLSSSPPVDFSYMHTLSHAYTHTHHTGNSTVTVSAGNCINGQFSNFGLAVTVVRYVFLA